MIDGCIGNCLVCGRCTRLNFNILNSFEETGANIEPRAGYGLAVDIGTTSVVMALLELSSGKVVARHSFMNPQRPFGADVISRISAAGNGKLEVMRRVIIEAVASGADELIKHCGIPPEQIVDMSVAGNTVMTYLLLGFPCESLGVLPFKPACNLAKSYDYAGLFGSSGISCPVRIAPWFSAFVGGDIMAGILHVLASGGERFMLIDLGTNGEMALYDGSALTVTSTAAGPAFEGGRQGGGASSVLKELAGFVRDGYVDETGLLRADAPPTFNQKEIRDLQLAKSAVRSGLEILLEAAGLGCGGIDAVYLAGGIGQAMDIDSAVTVGLLPAEFMDKVIAVGNASLGGAARLLLQPQWAATEVNCIRAGAVEINLALHPHFNQYFMENMFFEVQKYGYR